MFQTKPIDSDHFTIEEMEEKYHFERETHNNVLLINITQTLKTVGLDYNISCMFKFRVFFFKIIIISNIGSLYPRVIHMISQLILLLRSLHDGSRYKCRMKLNNTALRSQVENVRLVT